MLFRDYLVGRDAPTVHADTTPSPSQRETVVSLHLVGRGHVDFNGLVPQFRTAPVDSMVYISPLATTNVTWQWAR